MGVVGVIVVSALVLVDPIVTHSHGEQPGTFGLVARSQESMRCHTSSATYRHPTDCSVFYKCFAYQLFKGICPGGLYFHEHLQVCDFPYRVDCDARKHKKHDENSSH